MTSSPRVTVPELAGIDDRPDECALGANGIELFAEEIVDDAVLDAAADRIVGAGIGGQQHLIVAVGFGLDLSFRVLVGLVGAVTRIEEHDIVLRTGRRGELVESVRDVRKGRRTLDGRELRISAGRPSVSTMMSAGSTPRDLKSRHMIETSLRGPSRSLMPDASL